MPGKDAAATLASMLIRLATSHDADALRALDARSWSFNSAPVITDGKKWLCADAPTADTLVAEDHTEVIGYVTVSRAFPEHVESGKHMARISSLCVAPERRGQRIGAGLLAAADEFALSRGMHKLVLQALATNTSAHRTYLRHGFVIEGRVTRCFLLEGRWIDDLHFGKWLG